MEKSIQVPKELKTLLSCGLCHRPYDLTTGLLPQELVCQHSFCEECVYRNTDRNSSECICYLCGYRTQLHGQKLPESMAIMYLLRELPALMLGRAMLDFSDKKSSSSSTIEISSDDVPNAAAKNWLEEISVDSFLATSVEHCFIHAMPNSTWCHTCQRLLCRACSDVPLHQDHILVRQVDYHDLIRHLLNSEMAKIKGTAVHATELATREMELLRELCEACYYVQLHVKRVLLEHHPSMVAATMMGWHRRAAQDLSRAVNLSGAEMLQLLAHLAKQRRQYERQLGEVHFQCRMRAAVQENGMQVLDFETLNNRIARLRSHPRPGAIPANVEPPQALILTNYCVFAYWCEVQREMTPPRSCNQRPEPDLLPQSRRAVVPPHFNHRLREAEVRDYMQQIEQVQNQALSRPPYDGSPESSSSPGSSSSSSNSQSNMIAPDLDHGLRELVLQWQADLQQPPQMQQQMQQQQQLAYTMYQTEAIFINAVDQVQSPLMGQPVQEQHQQDGGTSSSSVSIVRQPTVHCYPIYFLDMEIAGELAGRVLIEVRSDAAPRMADNFGALVRHERGYGYRGCAVFQAWGGESIITGDFESQSGRGGHSAFESRYFLPDDTGLPAHRGTVGMRRGQRRQDRSGFVGSQFRLVLNEMRSFTAIFGYIVQGIELVDRIAASGNALGRPALRSSIRNCGEYHLNR
ncbi:uncharacterized protein LOC6538493 isoform X1 [Drosophila yakuba]|uniref:Uncharacterized protein, isoform A n=1 Tax=Drosophila yakuba TaxID=7245 RepID=B4PTI7_DROYA|nr:uncharacterized protein LOC6538493 isoform X1 [Drosophila yakuba]EDW98727.1 uncharacterized protein Dyak_GE23611, isoform A [Drosophila yakuba]